LQPIYRLSYVTAITDIFDTVCPEMLETHVSSDPKQNSLNS